MEYEVTLEPHRQRWLLTLEATPQPPVLAQRSVRPSGQAQWMSPQPITEVLRYQAQAILRFRYGEQLTAQEQAQLRQLPAGSNPRTLAMGQQLRQAHGQDDQALIAAALKHLRTGGYTYTLTPGVYPSDTADAFWFDIQRGFCEHIASAFVVLMRAMDVPARIVTGYQGGGQNSLDGYWTVRQSDAHAWAEVWIAERGWVRVDPTGAVAPGRVGAFERLPIPQGAIASAVGNVIGANALQQMRAVWEAVNNRWNQWVLNYSQNSQMDLLKKLGFESPSWQDLTTILGSLLGVAALGGATWTWWERRQHDPWLRLLGRTRKRLEAAGLPLPDHLPPRAIAQRVQAHWGTASGAAAPITQAQAQRIHDWLLRLEQVRYAPQPAQQLGTLRREFNTLSWPQPTPGQ